MAVLIVLPVLGIDITVLSVFGGALGVGLGLGLQKIASNYVSGIIILQTFSLLPSFHQHRASFNRASERSRFATVYTSCIPRSPTPIATFGRYGNEPETPNYASSAQRERLDIRTDYA